MSRVQAFQVYRSCAASFSSRRVAQSLPRVGHRATAARWYSAETAESSKAGEQKTEGESSSQPQASSELLECEKKLQKKEAEVVDLTSRLRYLQADFLNLQRNAAREKEQQRDFAITRFAGDLLETADVLAIALKSVPQDVISSASSSSGSSSSSSSPSTSSSTPPPKTPEAYLNELYTGVEMTHRLLVQTLFKYNVKPFDPTGDKFDPNRHEALYQAPIPGKEPGTVHDVQKIGYTIKDRILRAAQVGVVQDTQ